MLVEVAFRNQIRWFLITRLVLVLLVLSARTEFSKCRAKNLSGTKRFQPTTSQKVGYNPSGRTPTKTTPGKEDGRTIGSTLINKGLNAITNQKDSVSSKKKPTKTPEPTGSARVTRPQIALTFLKGKQHFKKDRRVIKRDKMLE